MAGDKIFIACLVPLILIGLLYFASTRKIIEYDQALCILYVFDSKGHFLDEFPVQNIEKILFSSVGLGNGSHSYLIVYRDRFNEIQKVRLFPIPFDDSIKTIIGDTKLRNPDVITRNWSIGWNELSD